MASIVNIVKTSGSAKAILNNLIYAGQVRQGLSLVENVQLQFVRTKMVRAIRGGGRPVPPGVIKPEPHKYKFKVDFPEDGKYTIKKLKVTKMGGRDPVTGRVVVETLGGGHKQKYRWVDYFYKENLEEPFVQKVQLVRYCPIRSARIALAGSGNEYRWILAHQGMTAGDLVTTYSDVPRIPVRPQIGDSHPVGALPLGTMIFNISPYPGTNGRYCRAAGSHGMLLRRTPDKRCIIKLASKQEISVNERCVVTVGQASNLEKAGAPIGSPNRLRWLGFRPRSGLWHRKDGYCGRKIRGPKAIRAYPDVENKKTDRLVINL